MLRGLSGPASAMPGDREDPIRLQEIQGWLMTSRKSACSLVLLFLAVTTLPGCNAINPLCGSARPAPVLTSISPASVPFSDVQATFALSAAGSHFVASSVLVINQLQLATDVTSSTTLKASVGPADISAPGTYQVWVYTPAGDSGNVGCSSGGNSSKATLTVQ